MERSLEKGMVRDAAGMAACSKALEILRSCDQIAAEHHGRASEGHYGRGLRADALRHDLACIRARIVQLRRLIAGDQNWE